MTTKGTPYRFIYFLIKAAFNISKHSEEWHFIFVGALKILTKKKKSSSRCQGHSYWLKATQQISRHVQDRHTKDSKKAPSISKWREGMVLTRRQQARDGRESWVVFKGASTAALPASLNNALSSPTVTALKDS